MPVSSDDNLVEVLKLCTNVFKQERIAHVLIGAWALSAWGRPRATLDLDLLVLVEEPDLSRLGDRLAREGMIVSEQWLDSNPLLRGSQLRLHALGVTVDLMRPRDVHDRELFRRKRKKRIGGRLYWVVAPEDFVLQKLKVGRPRDFEDALSVLKRSRGKLDRAYIRQWVTRLGITQEWQYLLSQ